MSTFSPTGWAEKMHTREENLSRNIEAAVTKTTKEVRADAMKNTPVVSGDLRKGFQDRKLAKWSWEIYNDVKYAIYVEEGHVMTDKQKQMAAIILSEKGESSGGGGVSFVPGRHMLANAYHRGIPIMHRKINEAIRKALR